MQTAAAEPATLPPRPPRADAREIYDRAGRAFALVEKYQTPPDPDTYLLWYTYASGRDAELNARVDAVLASTGTLSHYDVEAICQELAARGEGEVARQSIGQAIQGEIDAVIRIVQEGLKNSDTFGDILNEMNDLLPNSVTPGALGGILANLVKENRRMAETTHQLHAGLQESQKQIATLNKELEEVQYQSLRDPLTSVANRRAFDRRLAEDVQKAFDGGEKLCLALADLDYFKKVNDTYGHQTGDDVLQMFASIIIKNIKGADMVARIGGEEFAIILPQTDVFAAYNLMVKIKRAFRDAELTCARSGRVLRDMTASFGIARYHPGMTPDQMMEEADGLLYMAKNEGRDRVKAKGL